jgi:hypothetical protein
MLEDNPPTIITPSSPSPDQPDPPVQPTPVFTPDPVITPAPTPPASAKSDFVKPLVILGMVVLLALSSGGGYVLGTHKSKASNAPVNSDTSMVSVPKDATATSECLANRGKQYILPKDIPDGPIYDVHDGKVIAIEYLVGLKELTDTPNQFKNLLLHSGQYDHITILPMDPHAGLNEFHFHVVSYMVPESEVNMITCNASQPSTQTQDMHH